MLRLIFDTLNEVSSSGVGHLKLRPPLYLAEPETHYVIGDIRNMDLAIMIIAADVALLMALVIFLWP